jgi:hypothetical protein
LAIIDAFNSINNQTCSFGYDDVARITSDNCGSVWSQTYDYGVNAGEYDNLSKSGSKSWNPGYNTSNNRYQNGATYDSDGNLKTDGAGNTYTWDAYGKMASENGTTVTYDAFGRMVAFGSLEYLYSPMGKLGVLSSSAPYAMSVPAPGGGQLDSRNNSVTYYYHPDWLGSYRTVSSVQAGTVAWSKSFSAYGDPYNTGTDTNDRLAGMLADTYTGVTYSTPNREMAINAARWLSPDPAYASWNAYAYPTDPNTQIDPSGLDPCDSDPTECGDSVPGGDFPSDVYANPAPAATRPLLSLLSGLLDALFGGGGSVSGDAPGEINAWNYMGESANYMIAGSRNPFHLGPPKVDFQNEVGKPMDPDKLKPGEFITNNRHVTIRMRTPQLVKCNGQKQFVTFNVDGSITIKTVGQFNVSSGIQVLGTPKPDGPPGSVAVLGTYYQALTTATGGFITWFVTGTAAPNDPNGTFNGSAPFRAYARGDIQCQ